MPVVLEGPQYRVAMCRMTLARVRTHPAGPRILAQVRPLALETIDSSRSLTWIPTTPLDEISNAMLLEIGPEAFKDFYAEHVNGWSKTKLFGPLMESATRIFGSNPAGYLKWLGRAWQVTTRNMGSVTTTEFDGGARVSYRDLPPSHCAERMLLSAEGNIRGIVQHQGATARIEVDTSDFEQGRLTFDVSWS